uniref:Putative ABC transporter n=1 Tax=Nocardioides sp. (strain JS1661) TaxID=1517491 RepID=A0A089MWH6_NOCS1|nr:putative ABC transporter [Nocardioides sp. JS1661]
MLAPLCASAALVLLAACGSNPGGADAVAAGEPAGKDVTVGLVAPSSGVYGLYGPVLSGVMKGVFGSDAAASGIELLTEDDAGDPQTALTKVRKLVREDGADVVVCCVNGAATLAVAPYLKSVGIPQIAPLPGPGGLGKFETAYSVGFYAQQLSEPFGEYAAKELQYEKAIILSSDFVQGHDVADGFKEGFTAAGGTIVKEIYPPLDTSDYGPFLSQISDADVVFGFFGGADAVRLVKQYDAAGLKDEAQLIGLGPMVSRLVLNQMGDAAVGIQGVFHYAESGMGTPADDAFVKAVSAVAPPDVTQNFVQANSWTTAHVISQAVTDSRKSGDSLLTSIASVNIEAPWGPFSFNTKTHYPVLKGLLYEVVSGPERLDHKVLGTFDGAE